ncbi:hypothetical protein [Halorubellus sp. PRR65]|uniref:DUF7344 domain-containing protein n=1 Tax=Halorubellus sp. PRR65 TaxID=3098148 RepID=UPI002B260D1F|nr:hypothetical protein [Halorubellus sp. PRR65]
MSKAQPKGGVDTTTSSDETETDVDGTTADDAAEPSDDEVFELLANQRRRFVLHYLRRRPDESVSLSTLSEAVAGWEHGVDPAELDYRERKSVRNSLHQFHLPKLDDAGIVSYDDRDGEITLHDPVVVDAYHAVAGGDEAVPWTAYVVGAGAGAVGVLVLAAVGVVQGVVAWALAVLAAMAVTAAHYHGRTADRDVDGPPPECRE